MHTRGALEDYCEKWLNSCATAKLIAMEYHLDHRVRLCHESKHKALYSWSLQEVSQNGEQIGLDQVPWNWSLSFSASELRYHKEVNIERESAPKDIIRTSGEVSSTELIRAVLHSGRPAADGIFEPEATYSMFGTNRQIKNFSLVIWPLKGGDSKDSCAVWGCISYTTENDFRAETEDDILQIHVRVSSERFNELRELVNHVHPDSFVIRLGKVAGVYSAWSPSVSTNRIKVLTAEAEHKVDAPNGCEVEPPRLGAVGEFTLIATSRSSLSLRLDPDESAKDDGLANRSEEGRDEPDERVKALTDRLGQIQTALGSLRWPMWLTAILLLFLCLK